MKDFDLSITICSWNTQEDLRACLASLSSIQSEANFEVIVVDNASKDGSAEMTAAEFPWVRLLAQTENLGFTGGHNLAMKEARGRHIFLLNSDTVVHPDAIAQLMSAAESEENTGIWGPKLLNPDGSLQLSCRRFPNPIAALFRNTPLGKMFPKNKFTRDYLMQDFDHSVSKAVDWVSGAALLITETCHQAIGGLDPNFFMFCEDVDLCWRAWDAGFEVKYLPNAVVTHKIGSSTSKAANKMIVRFHKSMFRFFVKHQLKSVPLALRPLAYAGAKAALSLRASLFLTKNGLDALKWKLRIHR